MGQSESKSELKEHYPFYPTDFEIKRIINRTDLDRNEIQLLWNHVWLKAVKENGKVDFENFVKYFCQNAWVRMQGSKRHEEFPIKSTFSLIDTNGDGWLEFRDFAIYIFTLNDKLSDLQMMRRSFQFYDKEKQRSIGKKEILSVMVALKRFEVKSESNDHSINEVMYPQEVEDMFNLIEEFDHNNDISEVEFLSATNKHKKLENFLRINVLEQTRFLIIQELKLICHNDIKEDDRKHNFSQDYTSLSDEKSSNSSEELDMLSTCAKITYLDWICRRSKPEVESTSSKKRGKLERTTTIGKPSYGATQDKDDWKKILENGCENKIEIQEKETKKDGFSEVFGTSNSNFQE